MVKELSNTVFFSLFLLPSKFTQFEIYNSNVSNTTTVDRSFTISGHKQVDQLIVLIIMNYSMLIISRTKHFLAIDSCYPIQTSCLQIVNSG